MHVKEQQWHYLTHNWKDKGVHIFPKSIRLKAYVIARLEIELVYKDVVDQQVNHYVTDTTFF